MSKFSFLNVVLPTGTFIESSNVYVFNEPPLRYSSYVELDGHKRWYKHECLLYERSHNLFRVNAFLYVIYSGIATGDGMSMVKLSACEVRDNIIKTYVFDQYSVPQQQIDLLENVRSADYSLCSLDLSVVTCN